MGKANFVQMPVCLLDLSVDPRRGPILRCLRAQRHNPAKVAIRGDAKPLPPDRLGQRMGHVKAVKRHDGPSLGLNPIHLLRISIIGHGKHADGIGLQQDQRINRHCDQTSERRDAAPERVSLSFYLLSGAGMVDCDPRPSLLQGRGAGTGELRGTRAIPSPAFATLGTLSPEGERGKVH